MENTDMTLRHGGRRKLGASTAVLISAALLASACGGSDGGSGGDGGTGGSGDPIKVGIILPLDSPLLSLPALEASAKVAVQAINDDGGIKGRELELVVCDDKFDLATAGTCATKLLNEDKVLTLAGSLSIVGSSTYPAIEAAGAINFAPYTANVDDLTNPVSFPFINGIAGWNEVSAATLSDPRLEGVSKLAILTTEGAAADSIGAGVKVSADANGIETDVITFKQDATDFAPVAAKVKSSGADAVLVAPNPSQVAPIYAALAAGGLSDLPTILSGSNNTDDLVKEIQAKGYEPIWGMQFTQDPAQSEARKAYDEQIAKYGEKFGGVADAPTETVVNSWLAIYNLGKVLNELPEINREELKKYMESQTAFETGMTHPLDFTKPAFKDFPRGFNKWATTGQLVDGKMVQEQVNWVEYTG
jgi:ABC-type branched-subunit amino acid transport system substrate-binding protein